MSHPLPRFTDTAIATDPLEIAMAQAQAREDEARRKVNEGHVVGSPAELRGIPAYGCAGVIIGTQPEHEIIRRMTRRRPID